MNGFRPPVYGPGQSEALMEDPMSLMLMMMGMPVLQQAMGQNNFIPHFTPSQALNDQFIASKYQRAQFNSLNAASALGNTAVANRLLGLRSMVTDAPASQLNKEQASMFASVINNPISKALLASQMGPDNMEALFFGRKGDPSALAAASNRIGFFRKDTLGQDKRMSGESMEDFATNVYQNLYGKGADVDAMHGFMAGQTGQVMENLFQRGQLPQSLGALTPAERVKAISAGQRDDATMTRLAEQFGHKEMMKDTAYASATIEERKKMLDARTPEFKGKLEQTFTEIDRFKANDPRAKSAGEIEKMEGYGTAARNVDAQRVSKVAKDYMGAVDAVREIFGDNGAGDAPMAQLIEALDSLSAGSIDRMDPGKVEKTMREMRVLARDSGMGLAAMGQLGARGEALAQMYGTPQHLQMQANIQTMQTMSGMRDAGMFSRKVYGDMTQGEAMQEAQDRIIRGQASESGKSMASLNRMYQGNKDLYKGTRLEAAMQAYNDPDSGGKYTFQGKEYNLASEMARNGRFTASALAEESGGNAETFRAFYEDVEGTKEYQKGGLELVAQKQEMTKDIAQRSMRSSLMGRMSTDKYNALQRRGQTDEQFELEREALSSAMSFSLTDVIVNETGGMSAEERGAHLEKRHKELMQQHFESTGMNKKAAAKRADEMSQAMFGDSEARRKETFQAISADANQYAVYRTGKQLSANDQLYNQKTEQGTRESANTAAAEAEENKVLEKGRESSLLQRSGEALEKMGQDPNYTGSQAVKDIFGVVPIDQKTDKLMTPEQAAAQKKQQLQTIVGAMDEERQKNPNATFAQLAAKVTEQAAAQDQLNTVGAKETPVLAVQQATAFNQLDAKTLNRLQTMRQRVDEAPQEDVRVGGIVSAAKSAMPFVQTGIAAAALYGNSSEAAAAIAQGAEGSTGKTAFGIAQAAGDVVDNAGAAAGVASKVASRVGVLAKPAAAAGKLSSALGAFGKVNAFLSPLLGGIAGAFEGASNGRGALEGGVLGALTGDAESGSSLSSYVGIEKGTKADKAMGVGGATAVGAMTGAAIGSVIPGVGTMIGAGVGAALGAGAELYKLATEPTKNVAQSQAVNAVQNSVNTTQNSTSTQQTAQGNGKSEITVNGTLAVRGLQEAVLQATGERPMDTPGGGAPVFAMGGA